MALPRIDTPIYDLELPLSKKKIRFRPFLVKEQKNLLMALESDDRESIENNIKQVLQNCTITEKVDIEKLPVVDVEYYFLQLRARSVGETVENKYRCDNMVDDKSCGNIMETSLNLLDIKIEDVQDDNDVIEQLAKVDTIVFDNVLEHIDDYYPILIESSRVLKKGGFAIVGVPSLDHFFYDYDHKTYHSSKSLEDSFYLKSFKCKEIFYTPKSKLLRKKFVHSCRWAIYEKV